MVKMLDLCRAERAHLQNLWIHSVEGIWQIIKQMLKCKKVLAENPLRMDMFDPLLM